MRQCYFSGFSSCTGGSKGDMENDPMSERPSMSKMEANVKQVVHDDRWLTVQ